MEAVTRYVAYVGFNGMDMWDCISGPDRDSVRASAERSANRCLASEGSYPNIEIVEATW